MPKNLRRLRVLMANQKIVRIILGTAMMGFLLFGCGNSDSEVEKESEDVVEVIQAETSSMETNKVETEPKAEESGFQEEVEKEKSMEQSNEMPEAQIVATVLDSTEFAMYMSEIGELEPHIVIYNEIEGYIIDMKEGSYYQLKLNDRIFINWNTNIEQISYSIPERDYISTAEAIEIIPDYEIFDKPHECRYKIWLKDNPTEEYIKLTCYLNAPVE